MKRSEKLKSWTQLKDKLPFHQKSFKALFYGFWFLDFFSITNTKNQNLKPVFEKSQTVY